VSQANLGPIYGNIAITGLIANTNYYFYPYWDERNPGKVNFLSGAQAGTPPIAWTTPTLTLAQQQALQQFIPLSTGSINVMTPAAGTGGGTFTNGGGGGGGRLLK
jgi:hypothetical protein